MATPPRSALPRRTVRDRQRPAEPCARTPNEADGTPTAVATATATATATAGSDSWPTSARACRAELQAERDAALAECRRLGAEVERLQGHAMGLVARASHEIRTPLSGVLGLIELARRLCGSELQRRHLDMAAASGRALTSVLNDVLDLAGLGAAPAAAAQRREPVDLDALFSEALRSITPQLGWAEFVVTYDYDSDVALVQADAGRLRQIVINLLGNAAKCTERGHIGLSARVRRSDAGRCELALRIEDTGPGIPAAALPHLFEPFGLFDEARQRGGTGLGLSIVKAIVAHLGGSIAVHSAPGEGTRFDVTLRLDALPAVQAPAAPAPGTAWLVYEPPFLEGGHVLCRRLARLGWAGDMLPSIATAVQKAKMPAAPPDVLLLAAHSIADVHALEELLAALPRTRVVLLSRADWQRDDIQQRALELGVPCPLVPLSHRTLLQIVDRREASWPPPMAVPGAPSALLRGTVLLVDDDEVNRLIGAHLLAAMGVQVRSACSGEAAFDACIESAPDLVLMDVQMPGMGGIECCRRLCESQRRGRLPPFAVIGLSADSTPVTADAGRAAGMAALLTKPCQASALHRLLSLHLKPATAA